MIIVGGQPGLKTRPSKPQQISQPVPETFRYKAIKVERFLSFTCSSYSASLDGKLKNMPPPKHTCLNQVRIASSAETPCGLVVMKHFSKNFLRNNQTTTEQVMLGKRNSLQ